MGGGLYVYSPVKFCLKATLPYPNILQSNFYSKNNIFMEIWSFCLEKFDLFDKNFSATLEFYKSA